MQILNIYYTLQNIYLLQEHSDYGQKFLLFVYRTDLIRNGLRRSPVTHDNRRLLIVVLRTRFYAKIGRNLHLTTFLLTSLLDISIKVGPLGQTIIYHPSLFQHFTALQSYMASMRARIRHRYTHETVAGITIRMLSTFHVSRNQFIFSFIEIFCFTRERHKNDVCGTRVLIVRDT